MRMLALAGQGALAEECVVDAKALLPIPASMSFEVAASLLVNYGTTYHALVQRAKLQPGETLLVLGADSYVPYDHLLDAHREALGDQLQVVIVPGGHTVLWDALDETASAVAAFLGGS